MFFMDQIDIFKDYLYLIEQWKKKNSFDQQQKWKIWTYNECDSLALGHKITLDGFEMSSKPISKSIAHSKEN